MGVEDRAKMIQEKVITIDTHDSINVKNFTDSIDYTQNIDIQLNIPNMRIGGLVSMCLLNFSLKAGH